MKKSQKKPSQSCFKCKVIHQAVGVRTYQKVSVYFKKMIPKCWTQ